MVEEEKPDHISCRLPEEILHHIISMLSFKEAVRISSLSTSWRSLMSPSRVNIERHEAKEEVIMINQIIESLSRSGHSFQTLKFHLRSYSDAAAFAVCTKGFHGELHLDFSGHNQLLLPRHSHSHSSFSLIFDNITSSFRRPTFSYIKILHLRSVSHLVGDMVSDLCSSCSSLESLRLEKCDGLESVDVKYSSVSSLKNFEMVDCANIVGIEVSANNLNSFSYKGVFPLVQLHNVPNLVDVALDFGGGLGRNTFDCEDALSLLSSIKDIETLTVSSWFIEAFCCDGVIFNKLDFQLSKLKELKLICSEIISSKTRDSCACFLHITPSLEELLLKIDYNSSCVVNPFTHHHWHEPHLWKDYATVKEEAIRLKYVKKIRIAGFTMERDELLWMDLLLHNAINLKEMIVDDFWRVARIPYAHLSYLKSKYFLIPCHDIDSYFVLIAH